MKTFLGLCVLLLAACVPSEGAKEVKSLQIGVKFKPEKCDRKTHNGDNVAVHYVGKLVDGTEFDNSLKRGDPISFPLGNGRVIKGWDQGVLGMCVGEKRRLKIPPHLGYGEAGSPPTIPGNSVLIFDIELVSINAGGSGGGGGGGGMDMDMDEF